MSKCQNLLQTQSFGERKVMVVKDQNVPAFVSICNMFEYDCMQNSFMQNHILTDYLE